MDINTTEGFWRWTTAYVEQTLNLLEIPEYQVLALKGASILDGCADHHFILDLYIPGAKSNYFIYPAKGLIIDFQDCTRYCPSLVGKVTNSKRNQVYQKHIVDVVANLKTIGFSLTKAIKC